MSLPLNFRDDLNAFVHAYPYVNYHECVLDFLIKELEAFKEYLENLGIEEMKAAIEELQGQMEEILPEIERIPGIEQAIVTIRNLCNENADDIDDLETAIGQINNSISAINDTINGLDTWKQGIENDIGEINSTDAIQDTRLDALEEATIGALSVNAGNFFFQDLRFPELRPNVSFHLASDDSELSIEDLKTDNYSISIWYSTQSNPNVGNYYWGDTGLSAQRQNIVVFKTSGTPAYMKIKGVLPYGYQQNDKRNVVLNMTHWQTMTAIDWYKVGPYTVQQLYTGQTPTGNNGCFCDVKFVVDQQKATIDMLLYNGRNSVYVGADRRILYIVLSDKVYNNAEDFYKSLSNEVYYQRAIGDIYSRIANLSGLEENFKRSSVWAGYGFNNPSGGAFVSYTVSNRSTMRTINIGTNESTFVDSEDNNSYYPANGIKKYCELDINISFSSPSSGLDISKEIVLASQLSKVLDSGHMENIPSNPSATLLDLILEDGYTGVATLPSNSGKINLTIYNPSGARTGTYSGKIRITGHLVYPIS